jgi:hypothetical protein
MAISRPFLLALLGVALLGATVFAVQNARNKASDETTKVAKPVEQAAPAPASPQPAQASGKLSAKDALTAILSPGEPIDSARFSVRYDTRELAGGHEHDYASVSGLFASNGRGSVPDFDIRVRNHDEVSAGHVEAASNVHTVVADGKPFVGAGDKMYNGSAAELKGVTKVRHSLESSPVATLHPFDLSRWLDNVKVEGVEKVDGVDATHVSGDVVAANVAGDIVKLVRAEAEDTGSQAAVPGNVQKVAKKAVKKAEFDAWVGSDRVVRRMTLAVQFVAPKALREPGDSARWTANVEVKLSDVNKVQAVEAPSKVASAPARKGMGARDAKDARNTLAAAALAVDAPGGVVGGTYSFLRLGRVADSTHVANKVLRAVEQHKQVVVFFRNPRSLDDKATTESLQYLESHTKKLVVFTDNVENTKSYGKLLEHLGVTQAPAIVFINRRGTASLVEGYVDGPSLAQVIADAR